MCIENLSYLRWNLLALEDNLVLDDPELAIAELGRAAALGQRAVVDMTALGLGPRPAELPRIARATGMHIVAGCGIYLDRPHPRPIGDANEAWLTDWFVGALEEEIEPGAGFRAGLLGLIGTSEPVTASEQRVVRAAGAAAAQTGAAVTLRLDPSARRGEWILDLLGAAGCAPEQVVIGNVDEFIELEYLCALARAGATLEWCFGNEAYYRDGYKDPTDLERIDGLCAVLDAGLAGRCVLGCSVWTKVQLRACGGMGYDHLLRRIVPALNTRGVSQAQLDEMLVENPRRLLERP